jgi:hypothetical protein
MELIEKEISDGCFVCTTLYILSCFPPCEHYRCYERGCNSTTKQQSGYEMYIITQDNCSYNPFESSWNDHELMSRISKQFLRFYCSALTHSRTNSTITWTERNDSLLAGHDIETLYLVSSLNASA